MAEKEQWGSRMGLVLAAAGNAVGIGNLLRFPSQAANNGGGAFMIPYVVCLLVFGLPMMWIAWSVGRFGGKHGHSSLPGMFDKMWKNPSSKYLGVLGLALPLLFCLYYTYIEAWCLAYAWFALTGEYMNSAGRTVDLGYFFQEFLGNATSHSYFPGLSTALVFLLITVALNMWVLGRGIAKGIELLAKIAMPALLVFCLLLSIRVLTLGKVEGTALEGLNFLYTPDFSRLLNANTWMAAAGQIFFTLSIGFGSMECYASYVRAKEDIALAGTTTAATNEFVEVIFGSMIAIPAAAIFFGPDMITTIAQSGSFSIGMISMPEILRNFPLAHFFGAIWFLLLFFAAFTSSVAVCQPVIAFLEDEAKLSKRAAAAIVGMIWILGTIPIIYFYKYGVFDEFDYWAGTIGLVVVAIVEALIFAYIFGVDRGWKELHEGAFIKIPRFFKFIMKYVTPVALILIFIGWAINPSMPADRSLLWNVAERANYPGKFEYSPTDETKQIQQKVYDALTQHKRDLTGWADVEIGADRSIKVLSFTADAGLRKVMDADLFKEWLQSQGFVYLVNKQPASAAVTIGVEALYRTPYIWLARMIMIFFFALFLVLVGVLWKQHHRKAEHGGAK
ncbi:sodium-dependent transporter [bacterium]|nr:sodium-dependent transporter [bacterium]